MLKRLSFFAAALLSLLLIAACGQKGPLYLPGNPSDMQSVVPPQSGAAENVEYDEDDDENADDNDP